MEVPDEPIDGDLTLAELRGADDALRAYVVSRHRRIGEPLGHTGTYAICAMVCDEARDYFLAPLTLKLTPDMSAWDVMRWAAWRWAGHPAMDDLCFPFLQRVRDGQFDVVLDCVDPDCEVLDVVLSEVEVDQLPLE